MTTAVLIFKVMKYLAVFVVGLAVAGAAEPRAWVPAVRDALGSFEEAPGTVRPVDAAVLSAKVAGTIDFVDADPGRRVRAGDVLVRIDDREIRARLESAQAALDQAERDFARFQKLHADRVITTQEFEAAQTKLRAARAAKDEAETALAYTVVAAPFDGVVTRRHVQRGDLAVPGRALVEVENPGALRLEATVPESLAPVLELGQRLGVRIDAARALLEGVVAEIAPVSDPASRTVLVKLDLPPHAGVRSGQFGRLRVPAPDRAALRIPESALIRRGHLEFVVVNDEGTARLRIVRTGRREQGMVEVLAGLEEGEEVFSDGAQAPADGTVVRS